MVTFSDIAELAGVSKATVSRVLNNQPRVSAKTRKKVLNAAKELGYVSKGRANALNRRPTRNLGIILTSNPYWHDDSAQGFDSDQVGWEYEVLCGIEEEAGSTGYNVFVARAPTFSRDGEIPRFAESKQVDGIFVLGGLFDDAYIARIRKLGIPIVIVGSYVDFKDVNCIYADNLQGAYEAISHLISLGKQRIAFINGPGITRTSRDKYLGYRMALEEAHYEISDAWVREGLFSPQSGYNAMLDIWSSGLRPDSVFCANVPMAVGVISFLNENGLLVPDDVAVVGYQENRIAMLLTPPLSCVDLHPRETGSEAARRMFGVLTRGDELGLKIAVPTRLIKRESSVGAK